MKLRNFSAVLATGALASQPVAAQTLQDVVMDRQSEVRVSAGITIPLGGQRGKAARKPRFDLGFAQYQQRNDVLWLQQPTANALDQRWRTTKLSLTLEDNPRLMMNGVQMARFDLATYADEEESTDDEKGGGPSAGLILGGLLGGMLVLTAATLADGVDAIEDLTDPD